MVGTSTPTISRAIKSGKLSAKKLKGGGYEIEISELERVWPLLQNEPPETLTMLGSETPNFTSNLELEVKLLREQVEDLKTERNEWRQQAQKVTALIEDHSEKKGFWKRLIG